MMSGLGRSGEEVLVVGVGMTRFGRSEGTLRSLSVEAVNSALTDAGLAPTDVDIVFFGNAVAGLITGQETIRGQVALLETGLLGVPFVNVDNACAGGSTAAYLAFNAVASGQARVALAVGAEKMTHPDKTQTFRAIASGVDLDAAAAELGVARDADVLDLVTSNVQGGGSKFMDIYAGITREYMDRTGATAEDFAAVSVKARRLGAANPRAQFREPVTAEQVLSSRVISPPLTMLMCSPIADGAAAVVMATREFPGNRQDGRSRVVVRSSALVSGTLEPPHAIERAGRAACERAAIDPSDVNVIELHDAASPAEMITLEALGICAEGEAVRLVRAGDTDVGGRVPVNPSGGLLAKGHPVGATGCAQLVELTDQLRGAAGPRQVEGARLALAQNGGGDLHSDTAAAVVTVLEGRDD